MLAQSPKQLCFSSSWTDFSSFFSVLIWLLKYIFFLPQFQRWRDLSRRKMIHFPTKQQIFVRNLNTLSFWKIPDSGLIDRGHIKGRKHFCVRNGSPEWLRFLAPLRHIDETVVSELFHAEQSHWCSLSNTIGESMPSLEKWNLLVVTYDVWLPDRLLGTSPRSFWKISARLLSLPFAQFEHKNDISIPCFCLYPLVPQNSASSDSFSF